MGVETHEQTLVLRHPALDFGRGEFKEGRVRAVWCTCDPWFEERGPVAGITALRRRWSARPEPTLLLGSEARELWRDKVDADMMEVSGIDHLTRDAGSVEFERVIARLLSAPLGELSEVQEARNRKEFLNDLVCAKHLVDNLIPPGQAGLNAIQLSSPAKAEQHLASLAEESVEKVRDLIRACRVLDMRVLKGAHLGMVEGLGCADDIDVMDRCLDDADRVWRQMHERIEEGQGIDMIVKSLSEYLAPLALFSDTAKKIKKAI